MTLQNTLYPTLLILLAALIRLLPHLPNVTPIASMALFGGVYLNKKYALLIPIVAMMVSDWFLGYDSTFPFVYASFFITGCIGLWLRSHKKASTIFLASIFSSVIFYLVTNFGVWLVGGLYPRTLQGLYLCFILAIPFFRNTLLGDLFYTICFFGGFALLGFIAFLRKKNVQNIT